MGSALLNPAAHASAELAGLPPAPETPEELRRQVAARLAAHRERRLRKDSPQHTSAHDAASSPDAQKSRIAAAVAERYANAQSYRAFLAAEAERAVQQAHAVAEIAARNAQAVAEAQQRLLDDLAHQAAAASYAENPSAPSDLNQQFDLPVEQALWPELEEAPVPAHTRMDTNATAEAEPRTARTKVSAAQQRNPVPEPLDLAPSALRVVLYDDGAAPAFTPPAAPPSASSRHNARHDYWNEAEALALDEEISFRQAPVFEEPAGPPMPLPANLIEFPRQLVASRKVRPRYAEGPLRDEEAAAGRKEQLRIFEVEPGQISTTAPISEAANPEPQWTSLWLDNPGVQRAPVDNTASPSELPAPAPATLAAPRPHTAKLSRRLLAGAVDMAITTLAGVVCATAFAGTSALLAGNAPWNADTIRSIATQVLHTVPVSSISLTGIAALLLLSLALQTLFFTFSDATPGMRFARIGLCTFSDNNPTRAAMRMRIPALVLSTAVCGLGFGWALLDQDRLTWHDLLSRMYQRSY